MLMLLPTSLCMLQFLRTNIASQFLKMMESNIMSNLNLACMCRLLFSVTTIYVLSMYSKPPLAHHCCIGFTFHLLAARLDHIHSILSSAVSPRRTINLDTFNQWNAADVTVAHCAGDNNWHFSGRAEAYLTQRSVLWEWRASRRRCLCWIRLKGKHRELNVGKEKENKDKIRNNKHGNTELKYRTTLLKKKENWTQTDWQMRLHWKQQLHKHRL